MDLSFAICIIFQLAFINKVIAEANIAPQIRVSFIPATSKHTSDGSDGLVEVNLGNLMRGTICDFGIGDLEASVLCYEMGFEAHGIAILSSKTRGQGNVVMSDLNCKERVMRNDSSTWKLTNCNYRSGISNVPHDCKDHSHDVHLMCFHKRPSSPPPPVQIPAISCNSSGFTSPFRLSGGNGWSGKLLYHHNHQWGTVCIEGMDVNAARAICGSLCLETEFFPLARVVAHSYADPSSAEEIVLSRISCPPGARNFSSDCTYVVGDPGGCTHWQDAGIECGHPPQIHAVVDTPPNVTCVNNEAHVCFAKRNPYALLNSSFISLLSSDSSKKECSFRVEEEDNCVKAIVPLLGCGSVVTSNATHTLISHTLQRWTSTSPDGMYRVAPFKVLITCAVSRKHTARQFMLPRLVQITHPVAPMKEEEFHLQLYNDVTYSHRLSQPASLTLKDTLFIQASLLHALPTSRLILQDCWATNQTATLPEKLFYIVRERCPTVPNVDIEFHNDTDIRIRFPFLHLASLSLRDHGPRSQTDSGISFYCSAFTCDKRSSAIQTSECFRACMSTNPTPRGNVHFTKALVNAHSLSRKRRSILKKRGKVKNGISSSGDDDDDDFIFTRPQNWPRTYKDRRNNGVVIHQQGRLSTAISLFSCVVTVVNYWNWC